MNKDANIDAVLSNLGSMQKNASVHTIPNVSTLSPEIMDKANIEVLVDSHILGLLRSNTINTVQIELLSQLLTYKAHAES